MQFTTQRRRQSPSVIIISLIDVLIVVLIFLMVTTTFKQQPSVPLALPKSTQPKGGASENEMVVTIPKQGPLYLKAQPITYENLKKSLAAAARANPAIIVAIRADTDAPVGQLIKVRDAAQAANITALRIWTDSGIHP
jgi:biopolymer transport protein ExbD